LILQPSIVTPMLRQPNWWHCAKKKAEAERQLSRDEATVALLESAVADAAKQEPLTKAFHSLTLRARGLNEPAQSFNEVARA
jgi:hypothetical protein